MAVRKELSSLLIIGCFLATTGYCYQQQQEDQTSATEELCRQSLLNTTLHTAITAARTQASPCPCTQNVMELDVTFRFQQGCYVQMFYEHGVKQKCCYDNYGNLMVGAPNGGYITVEQFEQDIEMAKHACCQDSQTCDDFYSINPSDDCSTFKVLHPAKSWGDPQITTIDHHTFSFNGHGEYVYLLLNGSSGVMEIQTRTDYLEEGNVDATIFVAFVIHAQDGTGKKSDLIHVHLDKNNDSVAVYLDTDTRLDTSIAPLKSSLFYIIYTNKSSVLMHSSVLPVTVKISYLKNLGLAVSVLTQMNGSGLAGSTKNNKFVDRNGLNYSLDASEAKLFNYSESWSVRNENESKFNYNLTVDGGNFTFYNSSHTTPRFLESRVNNLTELFEDWSSENITTFNNTCHIKWNNSVSNACLLAIARSKNLESGKEVIAEMERQHDLKRRAENKPPTFKPNMVTHVFVNYSDSESFTIDLSKYVEDANNDTLTFGVETSINSSTYTIDNTTGLFTWHVGGQARQEEVTLTFLVKDEFSERPSPLFISYCGCQKEEQCDFTFLEPLNSKGKFERYGCSCTGLYTSGRFCESRINPCDNIDCSSGDLNLGCDNSSDADNPCEPCPSGYQTSFVTIPTRQQNCTNIDECEEESPCDHQCNDTDGGYICSCYEGFALDSTNNSTCIDIDECKEGKKVCKLNEVCYDPQGNATCICVPGFSRSSDKDECKKTDGFSYTFTMALVVNNQGPFPQPSKEDAKEMLLKALNNSMNFTDVIINRVFYDKVSNRSRERREMGSYYLGIDFTIVVEETTTYSDLKLDLKELLIKANIHELGNISVSLGSSFTIEIAIGGSCSLGDDCHKASSHCVDNNGTLSCECNHGFKEWKKGLKFCEDINECTESNLNLTDKCFGGTCENKYDGWNCKCPSNTTLAKIDDVYPYSYRCQGNYSYIGNISIYRHDTKEYSQDEFTSFLQQLIKLWFDNETVVSGNTPSLKDLYVKTSVFHFNVTQEYYHGKLSGHWYNSSFILTLGDAVNISRIHDVSENGLKPEICTHESDDCKVFEFEVYNDTDVILCNLGNKCDLLTTTCNVSYGVYRCECKPGYARFDDYTCRDVDECKMPVPRNSCISNNGICQNSIGDWSCTCEKGYKATNYSFDNRTCEDIDECEQFQPCQGNGICNNTEGSWICTCNEGYTEIEINTTFSECVDIDECQRNYCNGTCNNTDGSFTCECRDGFNATAFENGSIACIDIDECLNETHSCKNGTCMNEIGSWGCDCGNGHLMAKHKETVITCQDKDECADIICIGGNCTGSSGLGQCSCEDGYNATKINGSAFQCEDINECDQINVEYFCLNGGPCKNSVGNWTCNCKHGYKAEYINATHYNCIDIDECEENSSYVCTNGQCQNQIGTWLCECNQGFEMFLKSENATVCKDIDECNGNVQCDGKCVNRLGGWSCVCPEGFKNVTKNQTYVTCEDIDECDESSGYHCEDGKCINSNGSWTCGCRAEDKVKTINKTIKTCEGGSTFSFNPVVVITTTNKELQNNKAELKNVLFNLFKKFFLKIFLEEDFTSEISNIQESRDEQFTYTVSVWVRAYVNRTQKDIENAWNSNIAQECLHTCVESNGIANFRIEFKNEDHVSGLVNNLCKIAGANPCNLDTTTCVEQDGGISCHCKQGFGEMIHSRTSCQDNDECKDGQCRHGNCSNTVGNFICSCPEGLDQPVTNSQHITICSGSNSYMFRETLNISRRLTETELQTAQIQLEEQIQKTYELNFTDIKVTVIVTITEFNREKRGSTKSRKYLMITKIISNVQRETGEFQEVLENISIRKIKGLNANLAQEPGSLSSFTGITTTPACDKECPNGESCFFDDGQEKCGCLGEEICEPKRLKTILSASAGSLGGVVAILVITIVIICRKRKNDAKRVQEKEDNISLNTIGNNFSNRVRTHDNRTSNVDGASRSSSFSSNKFGPGYIPRVTLLAGSEPRPDYDPQPVFEKPTFQRPGSMNMDYNRHSSPYYDLRGQQFLRNSGGSHNSGMDASRNSMNYFGHKMPVFNPLYADVKRKA